MLSIIIGLVLGASISLFLYALILSSSRADEIIEKQEENREWRKQS